VLDEVLYQVRYEEASNLNEKGQILREYAENLGAPEWYQTAIGLVPFMGVQSPEPRVLKEIVPIERRLSKPVRLGEFCNRVIGEMRRIKYFCSGTGMSIAEVETEHPKYAAWKVREQLRAEEDQDVFDHPNQWGPTVGYAKGVLAKMQGRSDHTITSWVKAYRRSKKSRRAKPA
jgi:hypothetical protein